MTADRVPEWVHMAEVPPPVDDEPVFTPLTPEARLAALLHEVLGNGHIIDDENDGRRVEICRKPTHATHQRVAKWLMDRGVTLDAARTPDVDAYLDSIPVMTAEELRRRWPASVERLLREADAARTPDVEAELDVAALADAMRFGFAWIAVPEPHEWPRVAGFVAREYERQMAAARAESNRRAALAPATPEATPVEASNVKRMMRAIEAATDVVDRAVVGTGLPPAPDERLRMLAFAILHEYQGAALAPATPEAAPDTAAAHEPWCSRRHTGHCVDGPATALEAQP